MLPGLWAFSGFDHALIGSGGRKRFSPVGGVAYGMPKNAATFGSLGVGRTLAGGKKEHADSQRVPLECPMIGPLGVFTTKLAVSLRNDHK